MPDPNYYEMLEIAPDATAEEVREAYRLLTMVWHPDRFPKDSKLWTHANEKMQQINEAYNALKNVTDSPPRTAPPAGAANSSTETARPGPQAADDPWQKVREQEAQRHEAKRRAQEHERRIQEEKRQEEEKRRQEAEVRQNVESEQRRTEAERLRILMREAQRIDEIKLNRTQQGLCMLCGRPLGRLDRLARRDRHRECTEFVEDTPAA